MEDNNNEIWVFLSHSNKDYEKVIQVRNLLEKNSFRPLMFFLKCLNEDDEIDDLIKREIDSRGRFILCDSENARNSNWVKKEIDYIKSKDRIYQTINIDASIEKITEDVLKFKKKSTVYISYTRSDEDIYNQLANMLRSDWDFAVFDPKQMTADFSKTIIETMDCAMASGMIIFLITESFIHSKWCINELSYVSERINQDGDTHNVVVLKDRSLPDNNLSQTVLNNKIPICNVTIKDGKLMNNSHRLYWIFMRDQIHEGVHREEPHALYIMASHFYWDDDRFDNYNMGGMRIHAAKWAKKAADKGYSPAQHLYDKIISEYPEIKDQIK